ncbi:hypothetical protein DL240_01065 [Lujinxingia litoralis]|uniref:CAAX prenyl protease 2/Lysostaphin resistance protein A-like domain-containing protein n=1 Tax=Lujinxingia litoralis TaxID=2211119 RepID=A0A328C9P3_9DELT|nr:MrtP family glutamic-type intramembrane protease [Lujinxingia litoralis]RAL24832.1 hypothetical protein DL240_01065 [Lujinxingia litoralis]
MTEPSTPRWREPLGVFALALVIIALLSLLSGAIPWLAANLVAAVGLVFFGLAHLVFKRIDADPKRFGVDLDTIPASQVLFGLAVTALIFPLFALGNHVWERQVLDRDFVPALENYRQWSPALQTRPPELTAPGARVWTARRAIHVELSSPEDAPGALSLNAHADAPVHWQSLGRTNLHVTDQNHTWELTPTAPLARYTLPPRTPEGQVQPLHTLTLTYDAPITSGAGNTAPGEPLTLKRGYAWILLWALTHLLLVALPEEYFYRGYLQTRLGQLLTHAEGHPRRFLGLTLANWLTSALFALGHLLVPVGGAILVTRAAVFFPSLLFGWMRERSGSIIAPVIFHAAANMMVLLVNVHYYSANA